MTTDQYIAKLNAASRNQPKGVSRLSSAVGRQHKRIFQEGKDDGGGDIKPDYSTKPI